jgi:hypothetical protein
MEQANHGRLQSMAKHFAEAAEKTAFPEMRRRLIELAEAYALMAATNAGGTSAEVGSFLEPQSYVPCRA